MLIKKIFNYSIVILSVFLTFYIYISANPYKFFQYGGAGFLDGSKQYYQSIKKEKTEDMTLVLGDSTGMASFGSAIEDNIIVLSLPSGTYIEAYYTLKRFIDEKYVPKNIVLLSMHMAYFQKKKFLLYVKHFFRDYEFFELEKNMEKYNSYPMLEESFLPNNLRVSFTYLSAKYHLFPLYISEIQSGLKDLGNINEILNYHTARLIVKNKGTLREKVNYRELNKNFYKKETYTSFVDGLKKSSIYNVYLSKILSLASANNIKVFSTDLPVFERDVDMFKEYFLLQRKYLEDKREITFINFQTDLQNKKYFRDDFHLNLKGSEVWYNGFKKEFSKYK